LESENGGGEVEVRGNLIVGLPLVGRSRLGGKRWRGKISINDDDEIPFERVPHRRAELPLPPTKFVT
jgi:hypothetical protein